VKYVDTDVFLYWALDHAEFGQTATAILRHIELNEKACTSTLSLYLIDGVLSDLDLPDYDFAQLVHTLEKIRNLKIEPLSDKTLLSAATIKEELDVPLDVAAGIVIAGDRKADAVYSNNADWEKGPLPRVFKP
jgi:PIN domain nuclease of toxin-antitoxin system